MDDAVLDHVQESLRKTSSFNSGVQTGPAVVLWPDPARQWEPAIRLLRETRPHLLTLGDFDPTRKRGPAIWLKCMIANRLPEADWTEDEIPIVYLPGVSRLDLRAVESCSRHLQPVAELQYRGVIWSQINGKDWTVNAFLSSKKGGLGLDVAQDRATQAALLRATHPLLNTRVSDLRGRRLDALDFDGLLSPDPVRDLLLWLDQPEEMEKEWSGPRWDAFAAHSRQAYRYDPGADGPLIGAEKLAEAEGTWGAVWQRFRDFRIGCPGLVERLFSASPGDLLADDSHYPKVNKRQEDQLRDDLTSFHDLGPKEALECIEKLESVHAQRRRWVWFDRGDAPLAGAIEPLSQLAKLIGSSPNPSDPATWAKVYSEQLWRIDWFALQALSSVKTKADLDAVGVALQAIYVPWVSDCAVSFQDSVMKNEYPGLGVMVKEKAAEYKLGGDCVFFVDGLRFDVGKALTSKLEDAGISCNFGCAWAPFPSVTASGKAWVSPVADQITGRPTDKDFEPSLKSEDKPLSTHNFRKLLKESGWQILKGFESGDPSGSAWVEFGDLDHYGHEHGIRLSHEIDRVCNDLVERINNLIQSGWKQITIVTDHGWLLVPGGMPKVSLDKHLTETRWGRCAVMKPGVPAQGPVLGWGWCPEVAVASAPGISCHRNGLEYSHGGLSLQECLIPIIDIRTSNDGSASQYVEITKLKWLGLRCRMECEGTGEGYQTDLRSKANDASTSFCGSMKTIKDGKASLAVLDDDQEGTAAMVVIMDANGSVVAKQNTVIGG